MFIFFKQGPRSTLIVMYCGGLEVRDFAPLVIQGQRSLTVVRYYQAQTKHLFR